MVAFCEISHEGYNNVSFEYCKIIINFKIIFKTKKRKNRRGKEHTNN
jgi:hypothetical protein